jgi:peptidoglycan/LPS O-acetylase OafA/YrhL
MTVGQGLNVKGNNFNLLRMVGALFIVFAHTIVLTGQEESLRAQYPLAIESIEFVGYNCLRLFFVFSGLMVAMSLDRRRSITNYAAARILRIMPPLLLVSAALAFIIGPLMTNLPAAEYFASPLVWSYAPLAGSGLFVPDLPGVFTDAPKAGWINPPIWTIRYEVICYAGLGLAWMIGLLRGARFTLLLATGIVIYSFLRFGFDIRGQGMTNSMLSFGMSFMLGTAVYFYREQIHLSGWLCVVLGFLAYLLYDTSGRELFSTLAFTYAGLCLGLAPSGPLIAYNRVGELSYSVYIWHWPIGQTIFSLMPELEFHELFFFMAPLSIAAAALSWRLVELPALRRVSRLAQWLDQAVAGMLQPRWGVLTSRLAPRPLSARDGSREESGRNGQVARTRATDRGLESGRVQRFNSE